MDGAKRLLTAEKGLPADATGRPPPPLVVASLSLKTQIHPTSHQHEVGKRGGSGSNFWTEASCVSIATAQQFAVVVPTLKQVTQPQISTSCTPHRSCLPAWCTWRACPPTHPPPPRSGTAPRA